jgi:hypothetical protein
MPPKVKATPEELEQKKVARNEARRVKYAADKAAKAAAKIEEEKRVAAAILQSAIVVRDAETELKEKRRLVVEAIEEYEKAREALWAAKPVGQKHTMRVQIDEDDNKASAEVYHIEFTVTDRGLVHFNRQHVCNMIARTTDDKQGDYKFGDAFRGQSTAMKAQSHPSKNGKLVKKLLTHLGVQHVMDAHRASHGPAVDALTRALENSEIFSPYKKTASRERIEASTCRKIVDALKGEFEVTYKFPVKIPSGGHSSKRILDLWCAEYQLNIECNEHGHRSYPPEYDKQRLEDLCLVHSDITTHAFHPHASNFNIDKEIAKIRSRLRQLRGDEVVPTKDEAHVVTEDEANSSSDDSDSCASDD